MCLCIVGMMSYPEEESDGKVKKANQNEEEENSKDGADYATHVNLLLVCDEGCGYDVSHQQEVDDQVEDQ